MNRRNHVHALDYHCEGGVLAVRVVRLAFNLYTDGTPSVDNYRRKNEQIGECREYSVSDIFCCGYAMYFWQGIRLRYPEYCRKQKSMERVKTAKVRLYFCKCPVLAGC